MVHYGAARQCPGCEFGIPKYVGRYPSKCPRCGEGMTSHIKTGGPDESVMESGDEMMPVTLVSRVVRIQEVIEAGQRSFGTYLNDPTCSRAVTASYSSLPEGFKQFVEGPDRGFHYRVEESNDPILIFEFDDARKRVRMFATSDPSRYLSFDPRTDIVVEDHEGTFEAPVELDEGILQRAAEAAIGTLRKKLSKIPKTFGLLRTVKSIWDEAQRESGKKIPQSSTMRMAQGLDREIKSAMSSVSEGWESPWDARELHEAEELNEAIGIASAVGLVLAVLGGVPLILKALTKGAKWMGFKRVAEALGHAAHVAHEFELGVIDVVIPAELSYAVYKAAWKRGWRVGKALGRASVLERKAPVSFEYYLSDDSIQQTVESGMYRLLLCFFMFNGLIHLLHAPLSGLFAAEAAATGVKGIEVGSGLKRAADVARAMESVNPENVRMVEVGAAGLYEGILPKQASKLQLFLTEEDATAGAASVGLALHPSKRLVGEEHLWLLVHEGTGYALGKGEVRRLEEFFGSGPGHGSNYANVTYGPARVRARHRAVDKTHDRVAGAFAEDKRASIKRKRKPGEGRTSIRGGLRVHVGGTDDRKPNKDVSRALQNKRNASKPGALRARIRGAKKFHRSSQGKKMHRDQGKSQKLDAGMEEHDATLRHKVTNVKDRILRYNAGQQRQSVRENFGPRSGGGTNQAAAGGPQNITDPTPDDHLEAILRRLIVTQDLDVLQDIEFDENTGSIYLFFDPTLLPDEVELILQAVRQARGDIELIASPDMSIPEETVESDWWVMFVAGPDSGFDPDPSLYARSPDQYATKVQAVVMAKADSPEAVAQDVDVLKMMKSAGS